MIAITVAITMVRVTALLMVRHATNVVRKNTLKRNADKSLTSGPMVREGVVTIYVNAVVPQRGKIFILLKLKLAKIVVKVVICRT